MRILICLSAISAIVVSVIATTACGSKDAECCPVSDTFSCSDFEVGGARSLQSGGACSGPQPEPRPVLKTRKVDAQGCSYWEPDPAATGHCGASSPAIDAGKDSSVPGASDAAVDGE